MRRRTAPKITTGVLVALSIIFSGCSPSERTAAGFWESRSVILRISREGKHGERYIVEWKEPGRRATGSFGGSLLDASLSRRDGRTMISEDPTVGDFAYSRLRDVLIWHGELFVHHSSNRKSRHIEGWAWMKAESRLPARRRSHHEGVDWRS
jgi:hypothetical protein